MFRNVPSSAALPIIRPQLGRQHSISDRAKVAMQGYLNHFLGNLDIVNSHEVSLTFVLHDVCLKFEILVAMCPFWMVNTVWAFVERSDECKKYDLYSVCCYNFYAHPLHVCLLCNLLLIDMTCFSEFLWVISFSIFHFLFLDVVIINTK